MELNNIVEFKETVELFVTNTVPYLQANQEVPNFNFIFSKEAFILFEEIMKHPFELPDAWTASITPKDIARLKQMTYLDAKLPAVFVHNHNLFFKYLTDIMNAYIALNKKYHIDLSDSSTYINLLRRIWLRMSPTDFNQVESFLAHQLNFLQNNCLDTYQKETNIGNYYGYQVKVQVKINETWDESTRCMQLKIYEDETNYHSLPNIYYDILKTEQQNICYIYAIQNDQKRKRNTKIERLLYKLNKGIIEQESQEYLDYQDKRSTYYPENISDVHPSQVLSLIYFIKLLNNNHITKVKVPLLQVLSYDYHNILSNQMKNEFPKTWTPEVLEDLKTATGYHKQWLEESYLHDKEWYERIVDKEDLISKNKIETLIRIFRRTQVHNPELEICNEPFLQGDYLDVRLLKKVKK